MNYIELGKSFNAAIDKHFGKENRDYLEILLALKKVEVAVTSAYIQTVAERIAKHCTRSTTHNTGSKARKPRPKSAKR